MKQQGSAASLRLTQGPVRRHQRPCGSPAARLADVLAGALRADRLAGPRGWDQRSPLEIACDRLIDASDRSNAAAPAGTPLAPRTPTPGRHPAPALDRSARRPRASTPRP